MAADPRRVELDGLVAQMALAVAADGGELSLVDVRFDTGVVTVRLSGACSSCALSSATLTDGVRRILIERLEWVTEVVGVLDGDLDPELSSAMGRGGYVQA
jgi:Fe-S cluster biogenesis protein NfuA